MEVSNQNSKENCEIYFLNKKRKLEDENFKHKENDIVELLKIFDKDKKMKKETEYYLY